MARRKTKKKVKTLNVILTIVGVFLFAFIVTMIVIFCKYGSVPDTLIQYTMGAGGLEGALCAAIKIADIIKGKKDEGSNVNG